eukprot:3298192-Pyramimonas_sp.AAC.1
MSSLKTLESALGWRRDPPPLKWNSKASVCGRAEHPCVRGHDKVTLWARQPRADAAPVVHVAPIEHGVGTGGH